LLAIRWPHRQQAGSYKPAGIGQIGWYGSPWLATHDQRGEATTMKTIIPLCMLIFALAGCMTYDEGRVGPLGSSVYQTHYQQIADKQLAANPGTEVSPSGTDGPVTERVMDGYRGVTGDAAQVAQPIQINIGN
jgi:hypothetical protein